MLLRTVRQLLPGLVVMLAASAASAQEYEWARKMFAKTDHDFGVVARGAETRYRLEIKNIYQQPVHISGIRKTCGCTEAKVSKETLITHEKGYIEIAMDTRKFTHEKTSSVTVTFDQPQFAEVTIPIKAYIRTDVVLTPGAAQFGPISKGADSERKIVVAYAGRESWTIKNVVSKNENISAKVVETSRGGGRVNYDLVVTVKGSSPYGDLRDQLTLITDDAGNPQVPVLVEARIEKEFTVTPELVDFGTMAPGAKKTVNVVVRGKKPFAIEKIESETTAGTFEVRLPQDSKLIHVVPLTMVAPENPGTLTEEFTVTITGASEPVTFKAHGKIVAPATAAQTSASTATPATIQPGS